MGSELYEDLFLARYELLGRGPDSYDCYGLVVEVSNRAGLDLPASLVYNTPEEVKESYWSYKEGFVELETPELYCLVAMELVPGYVTHVGIMVTERAFLHMTRQHGVLLTSLGDIRWKNKVKGFYKWKSSVLQ